MVKKENEKEKENENENEKVEKTKHNTRRKQTERTYASSQKQPD
jgi:hypothetical protein